MDRIDATALVVWTSFILYQPFEHTHRHMIYYETHVTKLRIFKIPWLVYVPLFAVFYIAAFIISPFLYFKWNGTAPIPIFMCLTVIILLDKLWPYLFLYAKRVKSTIILNVAMFLISISIIIIMAITTSTVNEAWYLPFVLQIPFNLFILHFIIFSIDWYYSVTLPAAAAYPVRTRVTERFCNLQRVPSQLSSFATSAH
jgi:hypothetical protein